MGATKSRCKYITLPQVPDEFIYKYEDRILPLPDELIYEIFLRLPAKSLARFRSLSKTWKECITSPSFVLKQHARERFGRDNASLMLIVKFNDLAKFESSEVVMIDVTGESKRVKHVRKNIAPKKTKAISYSLGIFCTFSIIGNAATLWNPATKDRRSIDSGFKDIKGDIQGYGFGHFCNKDGMIDLKIVQLVNVSSTQGWSCRFLVYTSRNDVWHWAKPSIAAKSVGETSGAEVNGVLHWLGKASTQKGALYILTFDLKDETCSRIELPRGVDLSNGFRKELRTSLDVHCPTLVLICAGKKSVDLRIMKKYGVASSWVRQVISVECGIHMRVLGHCNYTNQTVLYKYKKRCAAAGKSLSLFNYVENLMPLEEYSKRYPK